MKEGTSDRRNFIHQRCSYVSTSLNARITVHVNSSVFEQRALLCTERDVHFMYVCPCIIYVNDERYQLDAQIYLLS